MLLQHFLTDNSIMTKTLVQFLCVVVAHLGAYTLYYADVLPQGSSVIGLAALVGSHYIVYKFG